MPPQKEPSRREREILEAIYRLGTASAAEIHAALERPPTYTAVRTHLSNLESKGLVRVTAEGKKYLYEPIVPRDQMAEKALHGLVDTFFQSRVDLVVSTLLSSKEKRLSQAELEEIAKLIQKAKEEGL